MLPLDIVSSRFRRFAVTAAFALAFAGGLNAAPLVQGSVSGFTQYSPYDVSTGAADWAIWGSFASPGGGTTSSLTYASGGPQSFSALSGVGQGAGINLGGGNGRIKLNYTNGAGSFPGSVTDNLVDSDLNPVFAQGDSVSPNFTYLSFTHTLLSSTETIHLVLFSEMAHLDLSGVLSSGGTSFSLTNVVLPDVSYQYTGAPPYYTGLLTLDITGAQAGEVLTFTTTANYTGLTPIDGNGFKYNGLGIGAANVIATPIPEPSILTLVFGAGAMAMLRRRRR